MAILDQFLSEVPENDHCVHRENYNKDEYRFGDGRASLVDYLIVSEGKIEPSYILSGDRVDIYIKAVLHNPLENPLFGFAIKTVDGVMVFGSNTRFSNIELEPIESMEAVVYRFTVKLNLRPGDYFIDLGIAEKAPAQDIPLDVRKSLIHINLIHLNRFDGLVDLELDFKEITRLSTAQKITD